MWGVCGSGDPLRAYMGDYSSEIWERVWGEFMISDERITMFSMAGTAELS
jgi:hypothetical protein